MNINIQSNYDAAEANNIRLFSDKIKNREVDTAKANTNTNTNSDDNIISETVKHEKEKFHEEIQRASTMDVNEVKDFLFMLIGAEVKVKPENDKSGVLINRLA